MPTKKTHHATKSPTQLEREIAEVLAKPKRPDWIADVIDAARPVLHEDRDLAIVTWPIGKQPALYGTYKLRRARPGERPSANPLRPYFATVSKVTEDKINGYVIVRYGNKIIVYTGPETILARDEAA